MLVPKYYEDLEIMHENTMPYRAYYIPASCNMGPLVEDRFSSDRTICLNGTWKFQYFESLYDLQDRFMNRDLILIVFGRWRYRETGRIMVMIAISIPTYDTRFH